MNFLNWMLRRVGHTTFVNEPTSSSVLEARLKRQQPVHRSLSFWCNRLEIGSRGDIRRRRLLSGIIGVPLQSVPFALSVLARIGLPIGVGCLGRFRKTLLSHHAGRPRNSTATRPNPTTPCVSGACTDYR